MQMYDHFKTKAAEKERVARNNLYINLIKKLIKERAPSQLKNWKNLSVNQINLPDKGFDANADLLSGKEICDTAEEVKEMIKILRALGSLNNSTGFSNLINAIIDEGNLKDIGVKQDQRNAFLGIKPPSPNDPPKPF